MSRRLAVRSKVSGSRAPLKKLRAIFDSDKLKSNPRAAALQRSVMLRATLNRIKIRIPIKMMTIFILSGMILFFSLSMNSNPPSPLLKRRQGGICSLMGTSQSYFSRTLMPN
jgi:hypothetical protein